MTKHKISSFTSPNIILRLETACGHEWLLQATAATRSREIEHRPLCGLREGYYAHSVRRRREEMAMVESLFWFVVVVILGGQKAPYSRDNITTDASRVRETCNT